MLGLVTKLALIMLIGLVSTSSAQFRANNLAGGGAAGVVQDLTDFSDNAEFSESFRVFLRHSLASAVEVELGAALATSFKNDNFDANVWPIDARLLLRPFTTNAFSPYIAAGIGMAFTDVVSPPANANSTDETRSWLPYVPIAAGLQFKVSHNTSLELSGDYNFALSDELDQFIDSGNDGWFGARLGLTMTGLDWNADPDGDGLSNRQEKDLGTDMLNADSDGDGLADGAEVNTYGSNPLAMDSDDDGLDDSAEVNIHKTNPAKADSDGDGLDDKAEAVTYALDPNKKDSDGDGLDDKEELMTYKTDPKNMDSDADGLNDMEELMTYETDPKNMDSDDDGLQDGDEVNQYNSDPKLADSDGGSVNDGVEVGRGTNPLMADDDVVLEIAEVGAAIVLEGVTFASGKAEITSESAQILEKAYNTLRAYPDMHVEIQGYTDNTGSKNFNVQLSQRRAFAVRNHLVTLGIDATRVGARGLGPDKPIADNSNPDGRRQNRRIEFVRVK